MQMQNESAKINGLPLYGFFVFSSYNRQLTVCFFVSGSGITATLHPMWTFVSRTAKTVKFGSFKNSTLFLFVLLCTLSSNQFFSTQFWFLPNLLWSPQISIVPWKCCFRAHSNTDTSHFLRYWAQSQMLHSTMLHTWSPRALCLVFGSKCLHLISPWQIWKLYVYISQPQSLQESTCTFPILPIGSPRQSPH